MASISWAERTVERVKLTVAIGATVSAVNLGLALYAVNWVGAPVARRLHGKGAEGNIVN
jgi:hypothetical protein